jgi:ribosome-binding factor A
MAYRVERIHAEMQKSISLTLQNKIKDPRISGFMIGVTSVDCAKDLKTAKVYVSIYGASGADKSAAFTAVQSSAGFIRRELAADLKDIRTVPELKFISDESGAYGEKIDGILNAIKEKK